MMSYLSVGGQQDGTGRQAGAGDFTQGEATSYYVAKYIYKLCVGATQSGQNPKNCQHDCPAALPRRRVPDSVLAAV